MKEKESCGDNEKLTDEDPGKSQVTQQNTNIKTNQEGNMGSASETITILHFNDVYNIEPREQDPVGGAARFRTAIKSKSHLNPMVLFSGDAFNPSLMSTVTKGQQMVPVFNSLNIQCACYGNHDFDFGVDKLVNLKKQCNFPWLISNVIDRFTEKPLAEGLISHMVEWQGRKIGLLGLMEEEWIATLSMVDPDDITFIHFVEEGRRLAKVLREQGADFVIALTHMRWPNDRKLAESVAEIDLVLGGHDHDYNVEQVNGKYIIKSGTDFRNFSVVTLTFNNSNKVSVDVEEVIIDSSIKEDPEIKEVVNKYLEIMGEKMEHIIGHIDVELEGRFNKIRTQETNLGNFVTDIMLKGTNADVALLNSGTLRSDTLHPSGEFKVKDLLSILPMIDPLVVLSIKGHQIIEALENSVSQYPKLEGRFAQLSGITFAFDPSAPGGQRVDPKIVKVQDQYLEMDRNYRLVTKHYLSEGKDGYDVFKNCEVLVNDEEGPRLTTIVQNHFQAVKLCKSNKQLTPNHRQSIIPLTRRRSIVKQMSFDACDGNPVLSPTRGVSPSSSHSSLDGNNHSKARLVRRASIQSLEMEDIPAALAPKTENRIMVIKNEQQRRELEEARLICEVQRTTIAESGESQPSTPALSSYQEQPFFHTTSNS